MTETVKEFSPSKFILHRLLEEIGCEAHNKILIFVETKKKADELTRLMRKDGYPAMCIHGDKQQKERDWVLGEFRHGKSVRMT